ncbi:hypothetical protein HPMBJEAJ_00084 [Aeromonas phage avDM6]|nr:hypothetical protein HPMBJEAJ_00084 [Aeromonas phage avDM6]
MKKYHNRDTMGFQGYKIMETPTGRQLSDVCSQFEYRGFVISFSTSGYADGSCCHEVIAMRAGHDDQTFYTVEGAIAYIDVYHNKQVELDGYN